MRNPNMQKLLKFTLVFLFFGQLSAQTIYKTEKVFIHTDRDSYFQGDTIWFKATIFDGTSHKYTTESKVVYVLLINPEKKTSQEIKLPIKNGQSSSQFVIPKNSSFGTFYICGYTSLMKNFNDNFFFNKPIVIKNRISASNAIVSSVIKQNVNPIIQFFPEGGYLVESLNSKVAFKLDIPKSIGPKFEGKIVDSNGKLVTNFYPDFRGMGNFLFQPLPNNNYKAVYSINNQLFEVPLPKARSFGYILSTDHVIFSDGILVNVYSNINESEILRLSATQRGAVLLDIEFEATSSLYNVVISPESIPSDGIIKVTLSNKKGEKISDRLLFYQKNSLYNAKVSKLKSRPLPRAKSDLNISILNKDEEPLKDANLSVSIIDIGLGRINDNKAYALESYLLFDSDYLLDVPKVDTLFKFGSTVSKFYFDNLMITQSYQREINENKIKEETNLTWKGTAYIGDSILSNKKLKLYLADKEGYYFSNVTTDDLGKFAIQGNWTDSVRIIASESNSNMPLKLVLEPLYFPSNLNIPSVISAPKSLAAIKSPIKAPINVNSKVLLKEVVIRGANSLDLKNDFRRKFYNWESDKELKITEEIATKFENTQQLLEDTFKDFQKEAFEENLVKEVLDTLKAPLPETNKKQRIVSSKKILLLIDGVNVPSGYIHLLKPKEISQIDWIKNKDKISKLGLNDNQIVNILTKKGNDLNTIFKDRKTVSWMGYSSPKPFRIGKFIPKPPSNLTDKRVTLYWNPNLKTDANGKVNLSFYNSDLAKNYLISIVGTDSKGNAVSYKGILK